MMNIGKMSDEQIFRNSGRGLDNRGSPDSISKADITRHLLEGRAFIIARRNEIEQNSRA